MRAITANLGGAVRSTDRRVAVLAYDGLSLLEFAMACDVFGDIDRVTGRARYQVFVCGAQRGEITVDSGLRLDVPYGLATLSRIRRGDTVVVPPCGDPRGVPEEVLRAIRRAHARGARIISLCTGAGILAQAGLLDGRRATTHWAECEAMAQAHPSVIFDAGVLYVDDGDVLTSAGSAASIDLCLHVVRQDLGADVASRIARELVVPPYRDGGQAQYIETPMPPASEGDLFAETMSWIQAHLDDPVTVDDLARRAAMSRRTFARRFAAVTGTTPYQWLLRQRLQRAQQLLETTDLSVDAVAGRSGFHNAGNLRKHFSAVLRTTPHSYRRAFRHRMTPALAG